MPKKIDLKPVQVQVHGCKFLRSGECNNCGGCDHECSVCPHGFQSGGKWLCNIHEPDTRLDVCDICTNNSGACWYRGGSPVTHEVCFNFPDQPLVHVVLSGICAYNFVPLDQENNDKFEVLRNKWQLS